MRKSRFTEAQIGRTPMPVPMRPNQRGSLDLLSDTLGACRKFRPLAVNDDCCRDNLALIADTSISGARVARELDAPVRIYGKPACIVSDNGTVSTTPRPLVMNEGRPGAGQSAWPEAPAARPRAEKLGMALGSIRKIPAFPIKIKMIRRYVAEGMGLISNLLLWMHPHLQGISEP